MLHALALFVSGLGVGWLSGISISGAAQGLLASVATIVVGVTSALAGVKISTTPARLEGDDRPSAANKLEINPVPVSLTVAGLMLGASLGVYARTNELLGVNPNHLVAKWSSVEVKKDEVAKRVLDRLYPVSPPVPRAPADEAYVYLRKGEIGRANAVDYKKSTGALSPEDAYQQMYAIATEYERRLQGADQ